MAEPGALTAALNWYRAIPLTDMRGFAHKIMSPRCTCGAMANRSTRKGCPQRGRYVTGEYRFETLHGFALDAR